MYKQQHIAPLILLVLSLTVGCKAKHTQRKPPSGTAQHESKKRKVHFNEVVAVKEYNPEESPCKVSKAQPASSQPYPNKQPLKSALKKPGKGNRNAEKKHVRWSDSTKG